MFRVEDLLVQQRETHKSTSKQISTKSAFISIKLNTHAILHEALIGLNCKYDKVKLVDKSSIQNTIYLENNKIVCNQPFFSY